MDCLYFEFPAKAQYLLSVRLLVSSIGARIDMNIDEIEDLKSGAAEACLAVMGSGSPARIACRIEIDGDALRVRITGEGTSSESPDINPTEAELSRYMLEALVEQAEFAQDESGAIRSVSFLKRRQRRPGR
ncbi:MAG: hypothetical protein ACOX7W_02115 [Christensenellales bacterium]|jgi:serine/threonine-protein kinase RsbW